MNELRGTGTALVTPFKKEGGIDFEALEKLIEHQIAGKVEYLVILGTTGESAVLSAQEKKQIFEFVAKTVRGRVGLVAGIGGNNTAEVVETVRAFSTEGYCAILSVSPYYNKPVQEGIYRHYVAVADASVLPIILYNVPGRTGANIAPQTALRLARHQNIIGIKEASGNFDQFMAILKHIPQDFIFISGDDALALPMIALGAQGLISVVSNAYPAEFSEMIRLCLKGDFAAAHKLHYKYVDIISMLFAEGSPAGVKAFLKELNLCKDTLRLPLVNVSAEHAQKIHHTVKTL